MSDEYLQWAMKNYPDYKAALGQCKKAVFEMKKEFPELEITNGYAHFIGIEKRMHWWLKDKKGQIIDPTAHQYPEYLGSHIVEYEEITDNHDARKYEQAKCPNCGEYYFVKPEIKYMHNQSCEEQYMKYLNG